ncbi:MAG: serine hydrolase domain-containing protein [Acidimicrobiales bacterium]
MTKPAGWTAPGWEPVAEVFRANFERHHEVGAAFSAYHRGEKVVDLFGGIADEQTGAPWEEDTVVMVFSTTKGAASVVANLLAERGELDTAAPASRYWPELAANGKDEVTVDHLLSHRAGLAWVDTTLTVDEALAWENVIRALEEQAPIWAPGTAHGYHATTFGWLVGEVVRRATGSTLGTVFRSEVAEPLGLDFWIGLPEAEERRVATLIPIMESITSGRVLTGEPPAGDAGAPDGGDSYLAALAERALEYLAPDGPLTKALAAPGGALVGDDFLNSRDVRAGEYAAFNGIGDARSIARMYGACIGDVVTEQGDKVRLIGPDQLDDALTQRTEGPDRVLLGLDIQWGLGFMLETGILGAAGLGTGSGFGHFGMGGSAGWADPEAELAMAYVMNRMDIGTTGDRRAFSLMKACYEVVGRG